MNDTQDDYELALRQVRAQERQDALARRAAELPAARIRLVALFEVVRDASLRTANDTELWLFDQAIKAVKGAR